MQNTYDNHVFEVILPFVMDMIKEKHLILIMQAYYDSFSFARS